MKGWKDEEGFRFCGSAWLRLLLLCAAILFEGMSLSGINVQLAEIQRELGLLPDQLQMVASAFLTTYASFLLVGGRSADRWGSRRVFLFGIAVFGTGSLGATLASNALQIIAARAVQGAGAATTAPAAVALITAEFPAGAARNRALGVFSAMGAAGFSLGVIAVGLVTNGPGWRWAFGLYVPLSAMVLAIAPRVPGTHVYRLLNQERLRQSYDWMAWALNEAGIKAEPFPAIRESGSTGNVAPLLSKKHYPTHYGTLAQRRLLVDQIASSSNARYLLGTTVHRIHRTESGYTVWYGGEEGGPTKAWFVSGIVLATGRLGNLDLLDGPGLIPLPSRNLRFELGLRIESPHQIGFLSREKPPDVKCIWKEDFAEVRTFCTSPDRSVEGAQSRACFSLGRRLSATALARPERASTLCRLPSRVHE
jgi:MFS family permease